MLSNMILLYMYKENVNSHKKQVLNNNIFLEAVTVLQLKYMGKRVFGNSN